MAASKATQRKLSSMTDEDLRARMEEVGQVLSRLQGHRMRPIAKLYGKRGPTPEQAARWKEDSARWNREHRAALDEYRAAVEVSNARYHASAPRTEAVPSPKQLDREIAAYLEETMR